MIESATPSAPVPSVASEFGFWHLIGGAGPAGVFAWLAVVASIVAAVVVVIRHIHNPQCHKHGTSFFAIAHVTFLLVVCNLGVGVLQTMCCPPYSYYVSLIGRSVGISTAILLVCTLVVSLVTRVVPKPTLWSCLGVAAGIVGLLVNLFGIPMIIHYRP